MQKEADWAKKRKPEYMGPGTIYYEREVYENPENQYARRDLVAEYRERVSRVFDNKKILVELCCFASINIWQKINTDVN